MPVTSKSQPSSYNEGGMVFHYLFSFCQKKHVHFFHISYQDDPKSSPYKIFILYLSSLIFHLIVLHRDIPRALPYSISFIFFLHSVIYFLFISHIHIAAAWPTFNDSLIHSIGIWTHKSATSRVSCKTPVTSFHTTKATGNTVICLDTRAS